MAKKYVYDVYRADGSLETVVQPKEATLEQLQGWVGGDIELVPKVFTQGTLTGHYTAYCNETGKLENLPVNPHFKPVGVPADGSFNGKGWEDWLAGDVVVQRRMEA